MSSAPMSVHTDSTNSAGARSQTRYFTTAPCGRHGIDVAKSFVIGDSPDDVRAAKSLGARGCLVRTGWATDPHVVEAAALDATVIVESLNDAVDWILIANV
jgi:ribonucleotide monophosphatase NagD (HAD superfamily)